MIDTNTIPGYRIIRQLGQGGSATAFLAIQLSFERQVALKIMSPTLNADPTFAMRFVREARIVAQMHHASIVPVFDVGEHRPYHYLSMEYLPGGDLRQRIVEGRSSLALALDVCMAICSALEVAHRKGFVHRDIKPQNILFREDGAPVLTDFGIARAIDIGTSLTVAGMFVGTPAYMSPEQVKGADLDARTDLYSLGMVFYEMLTGSVPFRTDSDSALSIAMKHLNETLPPLPQEYAHYQPIIDRLTAKDRDRRFSTATEVLHALRSMSAGTGSRVQTVVRTAERKAEATVPMSPPSSPTPSATPAPAATAAPSSKPWLPWVAGLSAAGVLGAIAAAFVLRPSPPQEVTTTNSTLPAVAATVPASVAAVEADATSAPADAQSVPVTSGAAPAAGAPAATTASLAPAVAIERPKDSPEALRQRNVRRLLDQASKDVERGALTMPPKDNAHDRYLQVLELDPGNAEARSGIDGLAVRVEEEVDRARRENKVAEAQNALDQLRKVAPNHPRIAKLQADISERRATLAVRSRRANAQATEHLTRANRSLSRAPLVVRAVGDAHDHYDKAVELAPEAPELPGMKDRLVSGYVSAAQYELSRNEPRRAVNVVAYARRRSITTPELDSIEAAAKAAMGR